jgi:hypothetical protein
MEEIISNTLVRPKFFTTLLGVFVAVSVLLAVTGIYGVLSFMVRQRTVRSCERPPPVAASRFRTADQRELQYFRARRTGIILAHVTRPIGHDR